MSKKQHLTYTISKVDTVYSKAYQAKIVMPNNKIKRFTVVDSIGDKQATTCMKEVRELVQEWADANKVECEEIKNETK